MIHPIWDLPGIIEDAAPRNPPPHAPCCVNIWSAKGFSKLPTYQPNCCVRLNLLGDLFPCEKLSNKPWKLPYNTRVNHSNLFGGQLVVRSAARKG